MVLVATVVLLGLTMVGQRLVDSARADSVADFVALAGAAADLDTARDVAKANGARVLHMEADDHGIVEVEISQRGVLSDAAAQGG